MERLTTRDGSGGINCRNLAAALEKLAAYEDARERRRMALFPCESGYIDRKALLEVLDDGILKGPDCPLSVAATVEQKIAFMPAADVAPVIHAKWGKDNDAIKCSSCGFTMFPINAYRKGEWPNMCVANSDETRYIPRFCSDCGARMDGDKN